MALIDAHGVIVMANEAWRRHAVANESGAPPIGVGQHYLKIFDSSQGGDSHNATEVAVGIRRVIQGELPEFASEYICRSSERKRRWRITVTPIDSEQGRGALVMHVDITSRRST